jgi:hypothetical protein
MASAAAARSGVTDVLVGRWHYGVATPVAAPVRPLACQDWLALEWEVTSPSLSRSW